MKERSFSMVSAINIALLLTVLLMLGCSSGQRVVHITNEDIDRYQLSERPQSVSEYIMAGIKSYEREDYQKSLAFLNESLRYIDPDKSEILARVHLLRFRTALRAGCLTFLRESINYLSNVKTRELQFLDVSNEIEAIQQMKRRLQ